MSKEKIHLFNRVKHVFTHHPWLKFIALILAIMLWLYVREEMKPTRSNMRGIQGRNLNSSKIQTVSKELAGQDNRLLWHI
jgi:YbbR domain-containing protein